mgnify:CR=1 FL=1
MNNEMSHAMPLRVLAFYHFLVLDDPEAERERLHDLGHRLELLGTILVASEGLNGTVVGREDSLQTLQQHLTEKYGVKSLKWSDLASGNEGFHRFKVRVKPEIVSFGVAGLDMTQTGEHVDAERWNALLQDPDVLVIDTRNTYEIGIGSFDGAISPETQSFREFPAWAEQHIDPGKHQRVAMFCTGGIRCEKSTNYLLSQGLEEVYHLKGGILKYLEEVPLSQSTWKGNCFVFDARVSVQHGLKEGPHKLCFACRRPILQKDQVRPEYEHGVSCHQCKHETTQDKKSRFRERQKQIILSCNRGEQNLLAMPALKYPNRNFFIAD